MGEPRLVKCKFCGQMFDIKQEELMEKHLFTCINITKLERDKHLSTKSHSCFEPVARSEPPL